MDFLNQPISDLLSQLWAQIVLGVIVSYAIFMPMTGKYLFKKYGGRRVSDDDRFLFTLGAILWPIVMPVHFVCLGVINSWCALTRSMMTKEQRDNFS